MTAVTHIVEMSQGNRGQKQREVQCEVVFCEGWFYTALGPENLRLTHARLGDPGQII